MHDSTFCRAHTPSIDNFKSDVLAALLGDTASAVHTLATLLKETLNSQYLVLWHTELNNSVSVALNLATPDALLNAMLALNGTQSKSLPHSVLTHLQTEFIANISADANWVALHQDTQKLAIDNCIALPVVTHSNELLAVVSAFNLVNTTVSKMQQARIDILCSALCQVMHNEANTRQLRSLKKHQSIQIAQQQQEIDESKLVLQKALYQRDRVQEQLVEMENATALTTMLSSLAHEMNTPLGAALTAASHLETFNERCGQKLANNSLKKSELKQFHQDAHTALTIIKRNVLRADQLMENFTQLVQDQHQRSKREINLCHYLTEVLLSLKPKLKTTRHRVCLDIPSDLSVVCHAGAIGQVLTHLIINSVEHAYTENQAGKITIEASNTYIDSRPSLHIVYIDDGQGMEQTSVSNLYKPFFSLADKNSYNGLGMHICYNLVVKFLKGTIDCHTSVNGGVRFELTIPM